MLNGGFCIGAFFKSWNFMAVIGIHKTHIVHPQMWLLLAKIADKIELLGWQDNEIAVYRINGDELPQEDVMISLDISFFDGITPFVNKVNNHSHIWQPLKH